MTSTTRRALLGATAFGLPVAGLSALSALAAPAADPVPALVARYQDANQTAVDYWGQQVRVNYDDELHQRSNEALDAALDATPTTAAGVFAMLRLAWEFCGPACIYGNEGWHEEMDAPGNRALAQAMRGLAAMLPAHQRPTDDDLLRPLCT